MTTAAAPAPTPRMPILRLLASEVMLGTLVAVLSICTAWAAYQGSIADSAEGDSNVAAQKELSLSNTEFLRATQDIIQDYTMYDGYYLNEETAPDTAAYYADNFSDSLKQSLERPDGPFDDTYYEEVYADADTSYDEAVTKFDDAQKAGDRADGFQLILLVFAVGLSLAAWASLVRSESPLRWAFSLISLVTMIYGIVNVFSL